MAEYTCPHCGKIISDDDALLCFYCGESLNRNLGFFGLLRKPKMMFVSIVVILAAAFIIMLLI